ncbi:MAG: 50S ribosomal protein L13 [Bacteroidia bacterium]|nr:50S ribosomal protein L13 [Bacteroidia bacterium]
MDTLSYKTKSANAATADKKWVLVDAEGQTLGRLSSRIAFVLRGKHKPNFTPHVDCGDNVVVINAEKIRLTGKKMAEKQYIHHTTYPGGQRFRTAQEQIGMEPRKVIEAAVKGMLPKNRLGSKLYSNLYVYAGSEHPHQGQNPQTIELIS